VASIEDQASATIASFTYTGMRPKAAVLENGARTEWSYLGFRDELQSIHHKDDTGTTILDLQYAYDKMHAPLYERFGGAGASGNAFEYGHRGSRSA